MLSQTAEYALRAVLFIAAQPPDNAVRVDHIARELKLPASYLSKTLQVLVRDGVLRSIRGRTGGFMLAAPPARLPLARVVAPFDPVVERRHCLLGRPVCSDRAPCDAHAAWKPTAERIAKFFRETTVADITCPR